VVIGARHNIKTIKMTTELALDEENLNHPNMPTAFRDLNKHILSFMHRFLHDHGCPRHNNVLHGRDIPTIYFYVSDIQLTQRSADRHSLYAGRCIGERPYKEMWTGKRRDGTTSVLISLSTSVPTPLQYYKDCMRAVAELGWHSVVALLKDADPKSLGPLPPGTDIVQDYPTILALAHVDLVICLGGMGTSMEAMYHGVPLLMVTHGDGEGELYAANCEKHGLGIHLKGTSVTSDEIKNGLAAISESEEIKAHVKSMQDKVKRSAGAEEAVNWIETAQCL